MEEQSALVKLILIMKMAIALSIRDNLWSADLEATPSSAGRR